MGLSDEQLRKSLLGQNTRQEKLNMAHSRNRRVQTAKKELKRLILGYRQQHGAASQPGSLSRSAVLPGTPGLPAARLNDRDRKVLARLIRQFNEEPLACHKWELHELLTFLLHCPATVSVPSNAAQKVSSELFMEGIDISELFDPFLANNLTASQFFSLDKEAGLTAMGIKKVGLRLNLMRYIKRYQQKLAKYEEERKIPDEPQNKSPEASPFSTARAAKADGDEKKQDGESPTIKDTNEENAVSKSTSNVFSWAASLLWQPSPKDTQTPSSANKDEQKETMNNTVIEAGTTEERGIENEDNDEFLDFDQEQLVIKDEVNDNEEQ